MTKQKELGGIPSMTKETSNHPKKSSGFEYFLSLEIENVRSFSKKQILDLSDGQGKPAQWTVLLGENGTGKTTLLQLLTLFEQAKLKDSNQLSSSPRIVMFLFGHSVFPFETHAESLLRNSDIKNYSHWIASVQKRIALQVDDHVTNRKITVEFYGDGKGFAKATGRK